MSRSSGTGSPVWFMCPGERRDRNRAYSYRTRSFMYEARRHDVTLTGRTKPYRGKALGTRSTRVSREYECSTCGHVGWSNHVDLARRAGGT